MPTTPPRLAIVTCHPARPGHLHYYTVKLRAARRAAQYDVIAARGADALRIANAMFDRTAAGGA